MKRYIVEVSTRAVGGQEHDEVVTSDIAFSKPKAIERAFDYSKQYKTNRHYVFFFDMDNEGPTWAIESNQLVKYEYGRYPPDAMIIAGGRPQ